MVKHGFSSKWCYAGRWGKTSGYTWSNLVLKKLTETAVTTDSSISQPSPKRPTPSSGDGPYLRVPCWGALWGSFVWEGETISSYLHPICPWMWLTGQFEVVAAAGNEGPAAAVFLRREVTTASNQLFGQSLNSSLVNRRVIYTINGEPFPIFHDVHRKGRMPLRVST